MDFSIRHAELRIMLLQRCKQTNATLFHATLLFVFLNSYISIRFLTIYVFLLHIQVLTDRGYDGANADLWSCGVILFVLVAGYLPFDDPNLMELYKKVSTRRFNIIFPILLFYLFSLCDFRLFLDPQISSASFTCPPWLSFSARKLITRILDPNPTTVRNNI